MAPPRRPAKGAIHQGNPNVTLSFVTNNGTSTARSQARAPDLAAQDDRDILELLYLLDPSYASERPHPQTIPPSWPLPTPAQPRPLYDKKALLVGTNYSTHPDSQFRLKWGVRDAHEIAHFLHKSFGFEGNNMRVLTDDQPGNLPTKTNILTAMRWLVEGARTGDSLFFYFSGHAAQIMIMDTYEDEDELGECICAMDYKGNGQFRPGPTTPGVILDDDIHDIMVKTLPRGCRLTAVLDCCHSGTLLALPFIFDSQGVLKHSPNVVQQESTPGDVISLGSRKDNGRTLEAREGGALRKAFVEYMAKSGDRTTYLGIIQSLRAYMDANGFGQRPQLSSSRWIDSNGQFVI